MLKSLRGIFRLATTDSMEFTLTFLPPMKGADFEGRGALANKARARIGRTLEIPEFQPAA